MANGNRPALQHAVAEAALALTGLEVTLATLRDNGVIEGPQLAEVLHRLNALIETFARDAAGDSDQIIATMRARLGEMARYLGVDLRQH